MSFQAFDPETVRILSEALAAAWHDLEVDEPKYSTAQQVELMRALSHNMIATAALGERDPQKLRQSALNAAARAGGERRP